MSDFAAPEILINYPWPWRKTYLFSSNATKHLTKQSNSRIDPHVESPRRWQVSNAHICTAWPHVSRNMADNVEMESGTNMCCELYVLFLFLSIFFAHCFHPSSWFRRHYLYLYLCKIYNDMYLYCLSSNSWATRSRWMVFRHFPKNIRNRGEWFASTRRSHVCPVDQTKLLHQISANLRKSTVLIIILAGMKWNPHLSFCWNREWFQLYIWIPTAACRYWSFIRLLLRFSYSPDGIQILNPLHCWPLVS